MKTRLISFLLVFLLPVLKPLHISAQIKITDTIFYNEQWQICEAPIASYYRAGTLAAIDTLWYYTGKVKDLTIDDELLMEGEYSAAGMKHGLFKFYYPNGKIQATGNYEYDKMFGRWTWYYQDGSKNAEIYFNSVDQDFKFISYWDGHGVSTMENGIGKFVWPTNPYDVNGGFQANGSFKSGTREGNWVYFFQRDSIHPLNFKEIYKDGKYKRSRYIIDNRLVEAGPILFRFEPPRLRKMEMISYDDFFKKNGDSLAVLGMLNYLIDQKPFEIKLKYTNFDSAYATIIKTIHRSASKFDFGNKKIDADVVFKLGFNGYPEEVTISGEGLEPKEENLIRYILNKFKHIDMPGEGSVVIEGYHHIYIYSLNVSEYYPAAMRDLINITLFVGDVPKSRMLADLKANKKSIRKKLEQLIWYN